MHVDGSLALPWCGRSARRVPMTLFSCRVLNSASSSTVWCLLSASLRWNKHRAANARKASQGKKRKWNTNTTPWWKGVQTMLCIYKGFLSRTRIKGFIHENGGFWCLVPNWNNNLTNTCLLASGFLLKAVWPASKENHCFLVCEILPRVSSLTFRSLPCRRRTNGAFPPRSSYRRRLLSDRTCRAEMSCVCARTRPLVSFHKPRLFSLSTPGPTRPQVRPRTRLLFTFCPLEWSYIPESFAPLQVNVSWKRLWSH